MGNDRFMVGIIGADRLLREGVSHLLQGDLDVRIAGIRQFGELADAADDPDLPLGLVILLEWRQDAEFLAALRSFRLRCQNVRIAVLADRPTAQGLASAIDLKVEGYLSRNTGAQSLRLALSQILLGDRIVSAELMSDIGEPVELEVSHAGGRRFTQRQLSLLQFLSEGKSNKEIARKFGTSESTVKVQVRGLLSKIGVRNRTQAAIWARDYSAARRPEAALVGEPADR